MAFLPATVSAMMNTSSIDHFETAANSTITLRILSWSRLASTHAHKRRVRSRRV